MEFAERLKTTRLEAGLTQKDIAEKLKIAYQSYQQWEWGRRNPNKKALENLSKVFNVSTSYLLGETNIRSTSEITEIMEQLSDTNQQKAIDYTKNLLNKQKNTTIQETTTIYHTSKEEPDLSKITNISEYQPTEMIHPPILGKIAAGLPIDAVENYEGTRPARAKFGNIKELFWLRIDGDSMEPFIHDGSYALIKKTPDISRNGQIAAVRFLDDDNATIKYVYKEIDNKGKNILRLVAENKNYSDIIADEWNPAEIVGLCVENEMDI